MGELTVGNLLGTFRKNNSDEKSNAIHVGNLKS